MTVYVDDAVHPWRGQRWAHLMADTLAELHAMAAQLGIPPRAFQNKASGAHYDVTVELRAQARHHRRRRRFGPQPRRQQLAVLGEPGPLAEQAHALGRGAQRAGHDHAVARLGPRAQHQASGVAHERHVHDDSPGRAREVAAHDRDACLGRALQQAVVERVDPAHARVGGQQQAHRRVAADAAHRRHVRQVHRERLAPHEPGGGGVAREVDALGHAVGGDEGDRADLDRRLGKHEIGEFVSDIQRPERGLYRIAVSESSAPERTLLVTVVYRAEPRPQ